MSYVNDDYFGLACSECGQPPLNCQCVDDADKIFRVLSALRKNGIACFLADGLTTPELDNGIKGEG